jgi:hypothetical protein
MSRLEDFAQTKEGRAALIAGIVIAGLVIEYSIGSFLGEGEATRLARTRMFVCSETGRAFEYDLAPGLKIPVRSPYSGKETGYLAEACYWTKEGKIKDDPTWVLLNESIRKSGPTFCPECGRLVVGHNPFPAPGDAPPPPREDYVAGGSQQ